MHCFKDHINNRKYFLHFIRLLLPPKSPILPNLGGDPYYSTRYSTVEYLYTCTVLPPTFKVHSNIYATLTK